MTDWIDLSALWRIVVAGLLFGAGLPALFGIGLWSLNHGGPARLVSVGGESASSSTTAGRSRVAVAGACLCFAVVLAAVGWGIYLIVAGE